MHLHVSIFCNHDANILWLFHSTQIKISCLNDCNASIVCQMSRSHIQFLNHNLKKYLKIAGERWLPIIFMVLIYGSCGIITRWHLWGLPCLHGWSGLPLGCGTIFYTSVETDVSCFSCVLLLSTFQMIMAQHFKWL